MILLFPASVDAVVDPPSFGDFVPIIGSSLQEERFWAGSLLLPSLPQSRCT